MREISANEFLDADDVVTEIPSECLVDLLFDVAGLLPVCRASFAPAFDGGPQRRLLDQFNDRCQMHARERSLHLRKDDAITDLCEAGWLECGIHVEEFEHVHEHTTRIVANVVV